MIEHETTQIVVQDLDKYYDALDKALLRYHGMKINVSCSWKCFVILAFLITSSNLVCYVRTSTKSSANYGLWPTKARISPIFKSPPIKTAVAEPRVLTTTVLWWAKATPRWTWGAAAVQVSVCWQVLWLGLHWLRHFACEFRFQRHISLHRVCLWHCYWAFSHFTFILGNRNCGVMALDEPTT